MRNIADINMKQLDDLYHLLRLVHLEYDNDIELPFAVRALTEHLTFREGAYPSLLKFSSYYGRKYLTGPICNIIKTDGLEFSRVVDLGTGLGWLGAGITAHFRHLHTPVLIDKRPIMGLGITYIDFEVPPGIAQLDHLLEEGDLIVGCDILHCLEDPGTLIHSLVGYPMVFAERIPSDMDHFKSYKDQLAEFGATVCDADQYLEYFPEERTAHRVGEYSVVTVKP